MSREPVFKLDPSRPLAVTMGDPAGVGLQIAAQAWRHRVQLGLPPFAIFASDTALKTHVAALGGAIPVCQIDHVGDAAGTFQDALPFIPVEMESSVELGTSDPVHAPAILTSIERAVAATVCGEASALVTNPITKATLTSAGFAHPGHTEYLGALAEKLVPNTRPCDPVMLLASDELRVVPLTVHMPLCRVAATISTDHITTTLETLSKALKVDFAIEEPRIAIAGLNPHAGENATIGNEDRDVILPAVVRCRDAGINVVGPLPADTMFHDAARKTYDAALCMYHDQALIPLKTLAFDRGVNITLGLPFVRTSPDHGTALDIVGTSAVSTSSFVESLKAARMIVQNRHTFSVGRQNRSDACNGVTP